MQRTPRQAESSLYNMRRRSSRSTSVCSSKRRLHELIPEPLYISARQPSGSGLTGAGNLDLSGATWCVSFFFFFYRLLAYLTSREYAYSFKDLFTVGGNDAFTAKKHKLRIGDVPLRRLDLPYTGGLHLTVQWPRKKEKESGKATR